MFHYKPQSCTHIAQIACHARWPALHALAGPDHARLQLQDAAITAHIQHNSTLVLSMALAGGMMAAY